MEEITTPLDFRNFDINFDINFRNFDINLAASGSLSPADALLSTACLRVVLFHRIIRFKFRWDDV